MRAPTHRDKILQRVKDKLDGPTLADPERLVEYYRQFLKVEEHRLKMAHRAGEGGLVLARKRADLVSEIVSHIWRCVNTANPFNTKMVLAAVGGFGRGELNPFSDIDLLFLFEGGSEPRPPRIEENVSRILYLLWDIGFKIGHSVRTVGETFEAATADFRTMTSLLESHYLEGDKEWLKEFNQNFLRNCVENRQAAFVEWRLKDQAARHQKQSNTVFLQEPNVKNSCGGLRDYHSLIWTARVCCGINSTHGLQEAGYINAAERKQLDSAYDFLLRVRTDLHYLQKHSGDILTLQLQGKIATNFGYEQRTLLRKIEALMRDYYQHAQNIYRLANAVEKRLATPFLPTTTPSESTKAQRHKLDVFALGNNVLECPQRGIFLKNPSLMLRLFLLAQQHNAELSPELSMRIQRRSRLIDRSFLHNSDNNEMLLALFSSKGRVGRICRRMHELGILGKIFPEFAPLTCLVQHEFFHRYTADEHTLVCLEMLDKIIDAQEPPFSKYQTLFQTIERPHLLYLAILLHDTGRSKNSRRHSNSSAQNAVRVSKRLHLSEKESSILVFLIEQHLTMSDTARRRNLDDEDTIMEFARIVQTQEKLDLLMLLSFADYQGTGVPPSAVDWKELVMWQLYKRTSEALSNKEEFTKSAEKSLAEFQNEITQKSRGELDPVEIEAHFKNLPPRYFNLLPASLITNHIQMIHQFLLRQMTHPDAALIPIISWEDFPDESHSEVTIVTWDREKLFSRVTGSFAACGITILSAEIFTREDNIVVDTFRVATDRLEAITDKRDKEAFRKTLEQALTKADFSFSSLASQPSRTWLGLAGLEFPTRINYDQHTSRHYTILDLQTPDKPGLLYRVSSILAENGFAIDFARITTEKGAALDTFYLCDQEGNKIDDKERLENLTRQLKEKLSQLNP